jgi:hypothetical protein
MHNGLKRESKPIPLSWCTGEELGEGGEGMYLNFLFF